MRRFLVSMRHKRKRERKARHSGSAPPHSHCSVGYDVTLHSARASRRVPACLPACLPAPHTLCPQDKRREKRRRRAENFRSSSASHWDRKQAST